MVEMSTILNNLIRLYDSILNFIFSSAPSRYIYVVLFLGGMIAGVFEKRFRWMVILTFIVILFPGICFLFQKQIYPARIFIHFTIFTSLIIGILFYKIISPRFYLIFLVVLFPLYLFNNLFENRGKNHIHKMGAIAEKISNKMIEENKKTIFLNSSNMKPSIEYHTKIKNYPIDITIMKGLYRKDTFDSSVAYDVIVWSLKKTKMPVLNYAYNTVYYDGNIIVKFIDAN
jgi:hypothetical protein